MFEQFRSHFPKGSLISELVQIDHGKYIVRASVQNDGLTLATGLAAAETVEQAEDQARSRALAVLDIALTPAQPQALASSAEPQQETVTPSSANLSRSSSSEKTRSGVPSSPQEAISSSVNTSSPNHISNSSHSSTVESEPASPPPKKETKQNKQKSVSAEPPSEPASTPTQQPDSSSTSEQETPMDSSDIIARTNVELRRLRWTNEQGRKFLEETYGKRSRSLLSESELLEFLQYLEKQPTPPQNSDQ
jgi:hypothetical protein